MLIISQMDALPFARSLVLAETSTAALAETPAPETPAASEILGRTGVAKTDLRPAGRAEIDGKVLDVVTRGDYIPGGAQVKVAEIAGNRIVVERA